MLFLSFWFFRCTAPALVTFCTLFGFFAAVGLALDRDDFGAMDEPIGKPDDAPCAWEDLVPLGERSGPSSGPVAIARSTSAIGPCCSSALPVPCAAAKSSGSTSTMSALKTRESCYGSGALKQTKSARSRKSPCSTAPIHERVRCALSKHGLRPAGSAPARSFGPSIDGDASGLAG
jgi:hypothetical protein